MNKSTKIIIELQEMIYPDKPICNVKRLLIDDKISDIQSHFRQKNYVKQYEIMCILAYLRLIVLHLPMNFDMRYTFLCKCEEAIDLICS